MLIWRACKCTKCCNSESSSPARRLLLPQSEYLGNVGPIRRSFNFYRYLQLFTMRENRKLSSREEEATVSETQLSAPKSLPHKEFLQYFPLLHLRPAPLSSSSRPTSPLRWLLLVLVDHLATLFPATNSRPAEQRAGICQHHEARAGSMRGQQFANGKLRRGVAAQISTGEASKCWHRL